MTTKGDGPRSSASRTTGWSTTGRYVDGVDVALDAHAAVLRSPHAHARIPSIDVDAVLDVEGVHLVWTHEDSPVPARWPSRCRC